MSSNAPIQTTVLSATVFKTEDATALLVHLADGQTYRVTTSDAEQIRIGMEGLQQAFPSLLKMTPSIAAVKVTKGAINGQPIAYRLVESKRLDAKGKPYVNVRLEPNLASAEDADVAALLGLTSGPSSESWDV